MPGQEAKYQQVIDWIKENIRNGTLKPGDRLMSENELSERFGLSRQTVRRATGELEQQGILTRIKGSGTYISGKGPEKEQGGLQEALSKSSAKAAGNIAVISTFDESYIFPGILRGIGSILTENGYTMQIMFTDNRLQREEEALRKLLDLESVDGLIVEPVKSALPNPNLDYYRKLHDQGVPILFFNSFYPELNMPCVRINDEDAACQAVSLLLDAGHKKIGAVFKSDDGQGPRRYKGFLTAMYQAGLRMEQENVIWLDTTAASSINDFGDYLIKRLENCTGVVCYNDQIAYQLIQLALDHGRKVPDDLSVVGIDDSYLAGICRIPFTSIEHPKEQLGRKVAEHMIRMIQNPGFDGSLLMPVRPQLRGSIKEM